MVCGEFCTTTSASTFWVMKFWQASSCSGAVPWPTTSRTSQPSRLASSLKTMKPAL